MLEPVRDLLPVLLLDANVDLGAHTRLLLVVSSLKGCKPSSLAASRQRAGEGSDASGRTLVLPTIRYRSGKGATSEPDAVAERTCAAWRPARAGELIAVRGRGRWL